MYIVGLSQLYTEMLSREMFTFVNLSFAFANLYFYKLKIHFPNIYTNKAQYFK